MEEFTTHDLANFQEITLLTQKMKSYLTPFENEKTQIMFNSIEKEYVCVEQFEDLITFKLGFSWAKPTPTIGAWITIENPGFDVHDINFYFNELGWKIKEDDGYVLIFKEVAINQLLNFDLPIKDALSELESDIVDIVAEIISKNNGLEDVAI